VVAPVPQAASSSASIVAPKANQRYRVALSL
jgi:hypothetical protein